MCFVAGGRKKREARIRVDYVQEKAEYIGVAGPVNRKTQWLARRPRSRLSAAVIDEPDVDGASASPAQGNHAAKRPNKDAFRAWLRLLILLLSLAGGRAPSSSIETARLICVNTSGAGRDVSPAAIHGATGVVHEEGEEEAAAAEG